MKSFWLITGACWEADRWHRKIGRFVRQRRLPAVSRTAVMPAVNCGVLKWHQRCMDLITNKEDLLEYLEQDRIALGKAGKKPSLFGDEVWKFQIIYRKYEYYNNIASGLIGQLLCALYHWKYKKLSLKLGFSIPINVFGKGLSIAHYGTIVVNSMAKIGDNCRIHENVTIGSTGGSAQAPVIGDNVFLGSGAKVIGSLTIADDVCVGAGAVVVSSVNESAVTVAGVPARVISHKNSHSNLNRDLFL